jgi:hypothetical protein
MVIVVAIFGSINSLPIYQPLNHNIAKPEYKSPSVFIINNNAIFPPSPPNLILYEPLEIGPVIFTPEQE